MDIQEELKQLKTQRAVWNTQFQEVGKWVSQTKQYFEDEQQEGEFLNDDIFDSTGTFAARNASSAILGLLWPSSAVNSIDIAPPTTLKNPTDEEITWFEEVVTPRLAYEMDRPEGNLLLSLDEYMLDQFIFGTSGIGTFYEDNHLIYRSYGLKEMYIVEGRNNRTTKIYLCYSWTAEQIVDLYGEDNVSEKVLKAYKANKYEKFKVIIKYHHSDDEVKSEHYEEDSKQKLKEGRFDAMPIHVGRFRKLITETYGRSPAMDALPDIKELNILREAVIVATEKFLDPALGVLSDSILGNGVIDTSSGAINVFDVQGSMGNTPPIFPINDVKELNAVYQRIEDLKGSIAQHFSIDRLLDFNNQTQMTATETTERSQIRNTSLSSLLNRQITEVFTPLVERSFSLMLKNDRFGYQAGDPAAKVAESMGEEVVYIPERIVKLMAEGKESYKVRFTTQADRIATSQELEGMMQAINILGSIANFDPSATAYLSTKGVAANLNRLLGCPPQVINSDEEADEIIKQRTQQAQAMQGVEQMKGIAETAKAASEAERNIQEGA